MNKQLQKEYERWIVSANDFPNAPLMLVLLGLARIELHSWDKAVQMALLYVAASGTIFFFTLPWTRIKKETSVSVSNESGNLS